MIHITDDVVTILTAVEGRYWAEQQRTGIPEGHPNTVANVQAAWKRGGANAVDDPESTPRERAVDAAGSGGLVIYGAGGWHRYGLDRNGNVVPLPESFSDPAKLALARRALLIDAPVPDMAQALLRIIRARDYCAERGRYPNETGYPNEPENPQEFDDWAADLADAALKHSGITKRLPL